jgi:CysZ protein
VRAPLTPPSRPKDFFTGIGMLGRGLGMYARSPGLLLLGILPAILSFTILAVVFGIVLYFLGVEARWITWFANGWESDARDLVRALAEVAIVVAFVFVALLSYTALTLAIGDPFYERISQRVEERYGSSAAGVNLPWSKEFARSVGEGVRLLVFSVVVGVIVFLVGLIPVVGQVVGPVAGALVGGWGLAVELTGIPFARRGVRLRDRRRVLRRHRWLAMGFGVSVFLCFFVPLGAVIVMPAAVAGATLLTRYVHGQPV